ncbi:4a-hydroxytetrahydrobiopterin dehydratase [Thiohalobacter sp.]|uniref:4a-hydroxytetrahydrobiopterin dehydratase n=1 Tax=Thiohalobacter sp. TaxID=2025948 RepID=UPI0026189A4A|nr:4a-hydroxytetrahydrobiopterin dehydratase [Thiohalobacter sp.]
MTVKLHDRHCRPVARGAAPLERGAIEALLPQIHADWRLDEDAGAIRRSFRFANFHETMAFVNALAWIAHREDHHPDLEVGYNRCVVHYNTHAAGGLTENDFICAAHIDRLVEDD